MKTLLLLTLLAFPLIAQDRQLSPRRNLPRAPQLMANEDGYASGVAQSPYGYPVIIQGGDAIPSTSTVSLYGYSLRRNGVNEVLIIANRKEYSVPATVYNDLFPKLEKVAFRLPVDVTGEVWVSAIGLWHSNWVRFNVEESWMK